MSNIKYCKDFLIKVHAELDYLVAVDSPKHAGKTEAALNKELHEINEE